jgi:hypothetical protein
MMKRMRALRPSPAIAIAILALVAGLTGAAVADPVAKKAVTKKKVRKIADKEINKLAPGLSVAHAATADFAEIVGPVDTRDLSFGLASGGKTQTNALTPSLDTFTTVATDSITLRNPGSAIASATVQVEDESGDAKATNADLRVLVDGTPQPGVFTTTVAEGATAATGIEAVVGEMGIQAGQHTFSLQARLDNEATISDRSLVEIIGPSD